MQISSKRDIHQAIAYKYKKIILIYFTLCISCSLLDGKCLINIELDTTVSQMKNDAIDDFSHQGNSTAG